ncbi:MAG: N-acetyltransferase [Chlorobiaceae bacterium]|nr:N-acetyltransferase [Chlorobiaceae bacterium]
MHVELLPVSPDDMEEMAGIFNHYVEHTLATWTETPVSVELFELLMNFTPGYPAYTARDAFGTLAGFGLLRPYSPIPAFIHTAELTSFLGTDFTGKGIGTMMLQVLEAEAVTIGIDTIIATVSSLNEGSLEFHRSRGFIETGCLQGVGLRSGRRFDVVLLQKMLRVYGND